MKTAFILLIKAYRLLVSPILPFNHCRFYPSCSQYAIDAVEQRGVAKGAWLGLRRVLRCHPLSKSAGYDPVP